MAEKYILVTGGFDPLHSGHIAYFKAAKELGTKLVVGLNSDEWLTRKKGRPFMPFEERLAIIKELSVVDRVISFDDSDDTAGGAIFKLMATTGSSNKIIFANGGDRKQGAVPEESTYADKIEFVYGVGGEDKKNSSSWILDEWRTQRTERDWGYWRVLDDKPKEGYKVKELVIEPGKELSKQYHNKRNELWYVMKGEVVMNGVVQKEHGPAFLIPKEYWHHAKNVSDKPCHVLECQYGEECIEEDIVRDFALK